VIYGEGAELVTPIMESGDIDVLAFIGASHTASLLAKMHPKPNRLRHVLGLEANNPAIILPDVDVDLAVRECISGTLSFNGRRCAALEILFVHKAIRDEFMSRYVLALDELKKGLPWEEGVFVTPLPEVDKLEYLKSLVDAAVGKGASVISKGGGETTGAYFHPAVVFPVTPDMELYHVEQFGPVIPVVEYEHVDEPLSYVQHSNYGRQVSIFGSTPRQIAKLVDGLVNQECRVNINSQCPRGPDVSPSPVARTRLRSRSRSMTRCGCFPFARWPRSSRTRRTRTSSKRCSTSGTRTSSTIRGSCKAVRVYERME
jgi:glyceraldehyde-3-phosphate dehydrogenase (NADP+)